MQLSLFNIEDSYKDTSCGTKECKRCNKHKPNNTDFFYIQRRTVDKNENITEWLSNICKKCHKKAGKVVYHLAKDGVSDSSGACDCCGRKEQKLKLDHDHATLKFRGWLCDNCNTGIGRLGDNIEGLKRALAYLEKAEDE